MGEWNLQARRRRDAGRDAGNDLDGNAGRAQGVELLAAPAEKERIAAFQPDDGLASLSPLDEERVDLLLRNTVSAFCLADRDQLGLAARVIEHAFADQAVVENDIGRF